MADTGDYRTIYQRVGGRWIFETGDRWGKSTPTSSFVFIAPVGVLDREALENEISACVVDADEATLLVQPNHVHAGD